MRALLLLLVLVGMAEVGWGQRVYRDTFPHDPDTFVKIGRKYRSLEKVRDLVSEENPTYYSKHIVLSTVYGAYAEFGLSYWWLQNKETKKSYPFSVFTIFGSGFFYNEKIKFGWKAGLDLNGYPFGEKDRNELFHDFGIDTGRGNNLFLLPISLNLRRPILETKKYDIALMAQYSPLIFTGDGNFYSTQSFTANLLYNRYWQDGEHQYSFIQTGIGFRYFAFNNSINNYRPFAIELLLKIGMEVPSEKDIYKPMK